MGVYVENNDKYQPKGNNYMGAFSFASSTSTPQLNTNDGFANALLGNVSSYSQWTATTTFNVKYSIVVVGESVVVGAKSVAPAGCLRWQKWLPASAEHKATRNTLATDTAFFLYTSGRPLQPGP